VLPVWDKIIYEILTDDKFSATATVSTLGGANALFLPVLLFD
jgi:hypothetical protein